MRVTACLSWWDERPDWLYECVSSCAPFCSCVVALDGAYEGFPAGLPWSGRNPHSGSDEQAEAIFDAARANGMGCLIARPNRLWKHEPEKREALFRFAEPIGADWWFSIDADELAIADANALGAWLEETTSDVGWAQFGPDQFMPRMFRAIPGLRAINQHLFETPTGKRLGDGASFASVPVRIDHARGNQRTAERNAAEAAYFSEVNRLAN